MQISIYKLILILFAALWVSTVQAKGGDGQDFTLPDVNGVNHSLSDYRGKWVVVNYWATWCPPCLEEIPELVMFHDKHKNKDALVLGVSVEDIGVPALRRFMDDRMMDYPVLLAGADYQSPLGPVRGLPVTFLIAPNGEIAATHLGRLDAAMIERFIASAPAHFRVKASVPPAGKPVPR